MEYEYFKKRIAREFDIDPVCEKTTEHFLEKCCELNSFPKDVQYAVSLFFINKFLSDEPFYAQDYAQVTGLLQETLFRLEKILFNSYIMRPQEINKLIYGYAQSPSDSCALPV